MITTNPRKYPMCWAIIWRRWGTCKNINKTWPSISSFLGWDIEYESTENENKKSSSDENNQSDIGSDWEITTKNYCFMEKFSWCKQNRYSICFLIRNFCIPKHCASTMLTKFYKEWTFRFETGGAFRAEIGGIKQIWYSIEPY